MYIIYEENPIRTKGGFAIPDDFPATEMYLRHFSNLMYLDFFANAPGATFNEKAQARKEIIVARRKMEYWERHPNFDVKSAERGSAAIKRDWKVEG